MENSKSIIIVFALLFITINAQAQTLPEIFCPADIVVSNDTNSCSAVVPFDPVTATDAEDGALATTQTMGLSSGSAFPIGETIIEFSATDSDANTITCQFTVTVEDIEVPIVVCKQDYELELDTDGYVSINVSDLIESVEENCGYTVVGGTTYSNSITTTLEGGAGFHGNMFNIMAKKRLTIDSFDIHLMDGVTETVEIWYRNGSYIGYESDITAWTLLETVVDVLPLGFGTPTPLNLSLSHEIEVGELHAFYITTTLGNNVHYTLGTEEGAIYYSDDVLEFYEGKGLMYPFANNFTPRVFNGIIHYTKKQTENLAFDCVNLGENLIDITVIDANENEATCTTTVNVNDVTAPVLVCGPDPILYDAGSVSDSPALEIDTNAGNVTITSVINIADDFPISDLDVVLDVFHTWIGDLQVSLTSPQGTTVLLYGGLCNNDINYLDLIFDDEGIDYENSTCSDLQSGVNINIATIEGYDPLSTFDGESLMGDWTLTIEDTWAGLDGGMLNSWGLIYEYPYPNPSTDINIELDATGNYTITPDDMLASLDEACGIDVILTDVTDVDCSDIGTPIMVTVFANDASGNFASCQMEVNVVDWIDPVLTCPGNHIVLPDSSGTYTIPDYIALGETFATDNCTDASVIVLTQTPAPGSVYDITVGTTNPPIDVVFTVTDEYGNQSICQFVLEIELLECSVEDSGSLNSSITLFPNPSSNKLTIKNTSNIKMKKVLIYDVKGILLNQYKTNSLYDKLEIDVSNYTKGVYLVSIITENQSKTVKRLLIK